MDSADNAVSLLKVFSETLHADLRNKLVTSLAFCFCFLQLFVGDA